jgi:hypothetical protein
MNTSGNSVQQAREVMATRFPRPDVPSSMRKLPEQPAARPPFVSSGGSVPTALPPTTPALPPAPEARHRGGDPTPSTTQPLVGHASQPQGSRASRIEPLAAQRYKVQFTADAELKSQLELARDLMRHAHPSGDFGLIIGRALDLLIQAASRSVTDRAGPLDAHGSKLDAPAEPRGVVHGRAAQARPQKSSASRLGS